MKRILLCLMTIAAFLQPAGAQRDTASELSQGTISAFQKGLFLFAPLIYEGFGGSEEELRTLWKMTPPATHPGRRERLFAVGELWVHLRKDALQPDEAELRAAYKAGGHTFPENDWFIGGRFLIAKEIQPETNLAHWKDRVKSVRSSVQFRTLAQDYYASVGIADDGWLGKVQRGSIGGAAFSAFYSHPVQEPWVKETENGLLFGWVEDRGEAGNPPLPMLRATLEEHVMEQHTRERLEAIAEKSDSELFAEAAHSDTWTSPTTVYRIGGQGRTLAQAREALMGVTGDSANPEARASLAHRAFETELKALDLGGNHPTIKALAGRLDRLRELNDSLQPQFIERLKSITIPELKDYHSAHRDTYFAQPVAYQIVLAVIGKNPEGKRGKERFLAEYETFRQCEALRERIAGAESLEEILAIDAESLPGLRINNMTGSWRTLAELPADLQETVRGLRAGETSGVLLKGASYQILRVMEIRGPAPSTFQQAFDHIQPRYHREIVRKMVVNGLAEMKN